MIVEIFICAEGVGMPVPVLEEEYPKATTKIAMTKALTI